MSEIIFLFIAAWVFMGLKAWIQFKDNEFDRYDFLIGLPMCILFWPRVKKVGKK